METINRYSLEDFAERHRADFDLHEPRPELWDLLEKQLDAEPAAAGSPPYMSIAEPTPRPAAAALPAAQPVLRAQRPRRHYAGMALGLLALVLALGLGKGWVRHQPAPAVARLGAATTEPVADAALYLATEPDVLPASQSGANGNARLDTAVHGMERYYAAQLADRQAQLSQLAPEHQAEWAQDIRGLDSVYQQLKRELPRHPQPEVVLTAMNRNLQIRLDILDRQLELRGGGQLAQASAAGSEYVLADSRSVADNVVVRRHAR